MAVANGWHELTTSRARVGSLYRFKLMDGTCVPDPASRFQPEDVIGPSEVTSPDYPWREVNWRGRSWHGAVIYEAHVGAFTPSGTFAALVERPPDLVDLGITAVQLMPIGDFPGRYNWGYDGVLPDGAAQSRPRSVEGELHGAGNSSGTVGRYLVASSLILTVPYGTLLATATRSAAATAAADPKPPQCGDPMPDSARFALHRPDIRGSLVAGEQKIAALMKGRAREYGANRILIEANTEHGYVYRLIQGWAGRIRSLSDGRDQSILIFLPGDLFAVKSMFIARHPDTVRLLAPSLVERIDYRELLHAFHQDADVASRCIWQVIEEERRLHNWVVSLGQGSAEERLAMLLIDFHGRLALSRTIEADAMIFEMPLTQVQLADHLGITAIHVNRVLKSFREQEILSIRDGVVSIQDLRKLRSIAEPLLDPYERTAPEYAGLPRTGAAES